MIKYKTKGNWSKTFLFLERHHTFKLQDLEKYGQEGVDALRAATPQDTGLTSESWDYRIIEKNGSITIEWLNSNLGDGWAPIALLLQLGHATGTGGWVEGVDYINPALKPIFDSIARRAWEEVKRDG